MIGCVEFDRVPIHVGEGRGDRAFCQSRYFRKNVAHSVGVEVPVSAGIQQFADPEHLEQIELDITHVAFVVTHCSPTLVRQQYDSSADTARQQYTRKPAPQGIQYATVGRDECRCYKVAPSRSH